jgi:glycine/serine hydroxymethyltransferase
MRISELPLSVPHYAGLVAGGTMWSMSTQLGQIFPYADCATHSHMSAFAAFGGLIVSASAGLWSWRSANRTAFGRATPGPSGHFIASVSSLAGFLFAYALALQGAATLVLSGCEH